MKANPMRNVVGASQLPGGPSGMSLLDRFANKMESIATDVERSMNHMQQKINDKVQVGFMSDMEE